MRARYFRAKILSFPATFFSRTNFCVAREGHKKESFIFLRTSVTLFLFLTAVISLLSRFMFCPSDVMCCVSNVTTKFLFCRLRIPSHYNKCYLFSRDKKFVALKVVKSAAHYTETALDEIKLLKCVGFAL